MSMRALLVLLLFASLCAADLRTERTEISWTGKLPKKTRDELSKELGAKSNLPLMVYVTQVAKTQDQERFDNVVNNIAQFRLATKFFECVQISLPTAKDSVFLEGIKIKAPAILVFSSDRAKYKIVAGRPSAMKAYTIMRRIGQPAWDSNMKETLRKAKVLLGTYDQIDDAQNAIDIKRRRFDDAASKGEKATAKALKRDLDKDIKKRAKHLRKTDKSWDELWKLKRRTPKKKP